MLKHFLYNTRKYYATLRNAPRQSDRWHYARLHNISVCYALVCPGHNSTIAVSPLFRVRVWLASKANPFSDKVGCFDFLLQMLVVISSSSSFDRTCCLSVSDCFSCLSRRASPEIGSRRVWPSVLSQIRVERP